MMVQEQKLSPRPNFLQKLMRKLREASEIKSNSLREIFESDASVFENRTASVVLSTRGSGAQKITPHMAQKSKKKLDVIPETSLKSSERGAVMVEMAIILPVCIAMLTGILEVSMYIIAHNKLVRVAGVIGDTITRQNTTAANVIAIMNTSDNLYQPFNFNPNGSVVVSQISNSKLSNLAQDMRINWQHSINGAVSKFGAAGSFPINLPNNIFVISNQSMIITEVYYNYTPLVFSAIIPNKLIYISSVYAPRVGDMNTLLS